MFTSITRRKALLCFIAGLATALAFAPFYVWPILFITIPVFFHQLDSSITARGAVLRSFLFGYGYFIGGVWWIANALLVDVAKFGWMIPFCIFGLSAVLALYFALFGALYHKLKTTKLLSNLICFVALWGAVELLRSIGVFGFPWNLMGYTALASLQVAQLAAVIGVFGLSMVILAITILPVLAYRHPTLKLRIITLSVPATVIALAYLFGASVIPEETAYTKTTLRVVQPSIPQDIKGRPEAVEMSAKLLHELSQGEAVDITVWPETAYPFLIRSNRVPKVHAPTRVTLTGAIRVEGNTEENIRLYNSIVAIDPTGLLLMAYDKHQLVPFGEFVPLRSVLPLEKITPGNIDFSRGSGAQTILLRDLPSFSPLVCYEVIFPWMAAEKNRRPEWLLNTTNDGWYGDTPGPYQHLAAAQMRAIEQGLPLVRAANSGVSAIIDANGRIVEKLAYNARGALNARLPEENAPTLYTLWGDNSVTLLYLSIILVFVGRIFINRNK